jgi:hypothetical protein
MATEIRHYSHYITICGVPKHSMQSIVNVLQFCHQLIIQGKCHHGKSGDVEYQRTKEAYGNQ